MKGRRGEVAYQEVADVIMEEAIRNAPVSITENIVYLNHWGVMSQFITTALARKFEIRRRKK